MFETKEQAQQAIQQMCERLGLPTILPSGETFRILEIFDRATGRVGYVPYATRTLAAFLARSQSSLKRVLVSVRPIWS